MSKSCIAIIPLMIILSSCEHVIDVNLNSSAPAFVAEAKICKDSTSLVRLTRTTNYFSIEEPEIIEDATVKIFDGILSEVLTYKGGGYYTGNIISGTEEKDYRIEINYDGIVYKGVSYMPKKTNILSLYFSKSNSSGVLNPTGKMVFTITCEFSDNLNEDNYYMIRFISNGELLERYYLVTENKSNSGTITNINNGTISFSESIFYDGGEVDVQVFSIDESIYNYFWQLSDVLFWKRRVMPPTPYNPKSNIDNGALGYFAAWAFDSKKIMLE